MIKLYYFNNVPACKKVENYFKKNGVDYKKYVVYTSGGKRPHKLTHEQVKEMISKVTYFERGDGIKKPKRYGNHFLDELLANTDYYKANIKTFQNMPLNDFIDLIIAKPDLLRKPIIVGKYTMLGGYNSDEIERYLPRHKKVEIMNKLNKHNFVKRGE